MKRRKPPVVIPLRDNLVPTSLCPYCGAEHNGALATVANPGDAPSPGDITLCEACGGLCRFDDQMRLTKPDLEWLTTFEKEDPEYYAYIVNLQRGLKKTPSAYFAARNPPPQDKPQ